MPIDLSEFTSMRRADIEAFVGKDPRTVRAIEELQALVAEVLPEAVEDAELSLETLDARVDVTEDALEEGATLLHDEGVADDFFHTINFVGDGVSGSVAVGVATITIPGPAAVVATVSGTDYDLLAADAGKYIRLTNAAAKNIDVRPNATHALPANGEWHFRNVGAGDATFTEGAGVTINPPAGGSLIVEEGGTVTLKWVAVNEFDLIGVTAP